MSKKGKRRRDAAKAYKVTEGAMLSSVLERMGYKVEPAGERGILFKGGNKVFGPGSVNECWEFLYLMHPEIFPKPKAANG